MGRQKVRVNVLLKDNTERLSEYVTESEDKQCVFRAWQTRESCREVQNEAHSQRD